MKTTPTWTMAGTAWARLLAEVPDVPAPKPVWREAPGWALHRPEAEGGPSAALAQLAWELARLVPVSRPLEQRALFRLAWALLALAADGSSMVPLNEAGRARLRQTLERLAADADADAVVQRVLAGAVPLGLEGLIGPSDAVPIRVTADAVILHRYERLERRLAAALREQLALPPIGGDAFAELAAAVGEVRATLSPREAWTNEQQVALFNAVKLPFSVISGGPGTGKTSIVVALLRLLVRLGVEVGQIALAAPTGKAANRLSELIQSQLSAQPAPADRALLSLPEPRTLHRLLGYHEGADRFRHHEGNPLEQDVVIVDECSMVDLFLMDQLFRAARPRGEGERPRRLVLLGDGHQLPSVEAGMVLHHLADEHGAAPLPRKRSWHALVTTGPGDPPLRWAEGRGGVRSSFVVTLTRSHRMRLEDPAGAAVYRCAAAIREGRVEALVTRASPEALQFSAVEHLPADLSRAAPVAFFETWWRRRLSSPALVEGQPVPIEALHGRVYGLDGAHVAAADAGAMQALLRTVEEQRLLCLNRGRGPAGAAAANAWFAARRESVRAVREAGGLPVPRAHRAVRGHFAGEPVLFQRNDAFLKLFNGDHGVLAWTARPLEPARLRAVFKRPAGFETFELETVLEHLQRAYALTVHKAQGSQVDFAALLLPAEADNPLLVNQLVYTAVSRATRSVIIVGDLERLKDAAARPVVRACGVMERVARVDGAFARSASHVS